MQVRTHHGNAGHKYVTHSWKFVLYVMKVLEKGDCDKDDEKLQECEYVTDLRRK
jgi:hypothetical protein